MIQDRPLLGILLMTGFCLLAPLGDSMAKLIGASIPLVQVLLLRFAVQAAVLTPLVLAQGGRLILSPRAMRLTLLRTALHAVAIGAMFASLRFLPLADAIAIAYVMPFMLLALGWTLLGEEVGPRRLIACIAGFAGTLLVIQPSFADVGLPALLPVLVALLFSLFMLVTRQVAKEAGPLELQAVSGIMAVAMLGIVSLLGSLLGIAEAGFTMPDRTQAALLLAVGLLGTLAHLLMTWSLRFAPSATLAPMQYLEIPFATAIGWAVFGDLPDGLAALGIAITVGAGLYVVYRERLVMRPPPPPA